MATKTKRTEKGFVNAAGEVSKRVAPDSLGFFIRELGGDGEANGNEVKQSFSDYPEPIRIQAMGFGFSTVLGNTIGAKDSSWEDLLARNENMLNGEWAVEGEAGPRISVLADAVVAARVEQGKSADLADVTAKLRAMDTEGRKKLKADPLVNLAFEKIMDLRQKERLKAAREAAKGSTSSAVDALFA